MSGTWSGWLRRLRKGRTPASPYYWPDAVPVLPAEARPAAAVAKPDGGPDRPPPVSPPGLSMPETVAGAQPAASAPVEAAAPNVRALLCSGELAAAGAALAGQGEAADARLAALVGSIGDGEDFLRDHAGAPDSDAGDGASPPGIMLAPHDGSHMLAVVFGGDDGGYAVPPAFARDGRPHLLFVRDPQHCLAMQGVARLGGTYDDCLLAITRLVRDLGARRIVCIGSGAAAYSALRYGLDLGASGVLALGTLTRLERGSKSPGLRPGRRAAPLLRLTAELGADLDQAFAHAAVRPGLVLCRPAGTVLPGLCTLPDVQVVEAPRSARDLLAWAESSGRLADMFGQVLRCRPVG